MADDIDTPMLVLQLHMETQMMTMVTLLSTRNVKKRNVKRP